jgi:hypothetical protein
MELLIVPAGSINAPEIWKEVDSPPAIGNSTSSKPYLGTEQEAYRSFGTEKGKPQ